jgi:hypothetical protein
LKPSFDIVREFDSPAFWLGSMFGGRLFNCAKICPNCCKASTLNYVRACSSFLRCGLEKEKLSRHRAAAHVINSVILRTGKNRAQI